jgi:hypothetical protein
MLNNVSPHPYPRGRELRLSVNRKLRTDNGPGAWSKLHDEAEALHNVDYCADRSARALESEEWHCKGRYEARNRCERRTKSELKPSEG